MTRLHPPTLWVTARVRGLGSITLWRLAHLWQQARLRGAQWRLARGAQIHEQYKIFGVVTGLARQAVWPASLSLLLFALTEWVGRRLPHVGWLRIALLGQALKPEDYTTLAGIVVTVEATLLALFFTTVGVVASTTYSSVPAPIRNLFIQERSSTVYTTGVARALVFTTALLTFGAAGLSRPPIQRRRGRAASHCGGAAVAGHWRQDVQLLRSGVADRRAA